MKNYFTLLFILFSTALLAQDYPTCDGMRYRTEVFTEVDATLAQKFGEGTTIAGNFQELFLDVYEPAGDEVAMRPLLILAFGGSFISGERADMAPLCEAYARMGYVAVSIDYRLYDLPLVPFPTENEMKEVVVKSLSDMKAAIRYMREDAATENRFRIDPDQVFVGGVSAGAICAAHTAVLDESDNIDPFLLGLVEAEGGFEGNSSDNFEYSSGVQGFINMSGALNDAEWIDAEDPPFVSIHDDMDVTVPYGNGMANVFGIDIVYLEGSKTMETRANEVGVVNDLMTIDNSFGHVSYLAEAEDFNTSISFTANFVADLICGVMVNTREVDESLAAITLAPNPASDYLMIRNAEGLAVRFQVVNALGQRLKSFSNTNLLDLDGLNAGVYYLQIENLESNAVLTRRFVVK
jgi:hypothetical protein